MALCLRKEKQNFMQILPPGSKGIQKDCTARSKVFIIVGLFQNTLKTFIWSVRSIMQKYLEKTGEIRFEKIFSQRLGFLLLKDFAENVAETSCPQIKFYEAIKEYEKMETPEERLTKAREIYDHHIMVSL